MHLCTHLSFLRSAPPSLLIIYLILSLPLYQLKSQKQDMFLLIVGVVTEARTKQGNKEACRSQLSLTVFVAGRKYARPGLGTSVLQAVVIVSYCDPSLGDTPNKKQLIQLE